MVFGGDSFGRYSDFAVVILGRPEVSIRCRLAVKRIFIHHSSTRFRMDRTNTLIGVFLLAAAMVLFFWQSKRQEEYRRLRQEYYRQLQESPSSAPNEQAAPSAETKSSPSPGQVTVPLPTTIGEPMTPPTTLLAPPVEEQLAILENEFMSVTFTSWGGAIKQVALKKQYTADRTSGEPYRINGESDVSVLSFTTAPRGSPAVHYQLPYEIAPGSTATTLTFIREDPGGLQIRRTYRLNLSKEGPAPYTIETETRFVNLTDTPINLKTLRVNLGVAAPTESDPMGYSLVAGLFDGKDVFFHKAMEFKGSQGFFGLFAKAPKDFVTEERPAVWVTVKNQFFVTIVTPGTQGSGLYAVPVPLSSLNPRNPRIGIRAELDLPVGMVDAKSEKIVSLPAYIGPKELVRLDKLAQQQDLVMQFPSGIFGWVGFICKALLYGLRGLEGFVHNWGLAIILMTVIIRLLFWPLTALAAKSSKKMAKLAEPMKAINERYQSKLDNPSLKEDERQRLQLKKQKEIMELFQEHKVNPVAGCLPILIQIPIFISFYQMLQSAAELRFASFLWIPDLSLPDTVAHLWILPVNPISILMGVSMYYQMKLSPTPSTDEMQAKIMKMMPFVFLIFCYNFSSGLVLYWTVSNGISILQQYITNRQKDDPEPTPPPAAAKGKKK